MVYRDSLVTGSIQGSNAPLEGAAPADVREAFEAIAAANFCGELLRDGQNYQHPESQARWWGFQTGATWAQRHGAGDGWDRRATIMQRLRYCLDHDKPEGTTLVGWMADEVLGSIGAPPAEKAGLTKEERANVENAAYWVKTNSDPTGVDIRRLLAIIDSPRTEGLKP